VAEVPEQQGSQEDGSQQEARQEDWQEVNVPLL